MYISFGDLLYIPIAFVIVLGIVCYGPYLVGKILHVAAPTPRETLQQFRQEMKGIWKWVKG